MPAVAERRVRVRELEAEGLTHSQIAGELGVSAGTISRWMNPKIDETARANRRAAAARRDEVRAEVAAAIAHQVAYDRERGSPQAIWKARVEAVLDAQDALAGGEVGSYPALRQGLIDCASISQVLAEELDLADDPHQPEGARAYV